MKIELVEYPNQCWMVAEVFRDGTKVADINKFFKVTEEEIIEFDAEGSSGSGYVPGNVLKKISIRGCDFEHVKVMSYMKPRGKPEAFEQVNR